MLFHALSSLQASGMTPLMYAVKDNRTSILDRLIELGSDVGARNNVSGFLVRFGGMTGRIRCRLRLFAFDCEATREIQKKNVNDLVNCMPATWNHGC